MEFWFEVKGRHVEFQLQRPNVPANVPTSREFEAQRPNVPTSQCPKPGNFNSGDEIQPVNVEIQPVDVEIQRVNVEIQPVNVEIQPEIWFRD